VRPSLSEYGVMKSLFSHAEAWKFCPLGRPSALLNVPYSFPRDRTAMPLMELTDRPLNFVVATRNFVLADARQVFFLPMTRWPTPPLSFSQSGVYESPESSQVFAGVVGVISSPVPPL